VPPVAAMPPAKAAAVQAIAHPYLVPNVPNGNTVSFSKTFYDEDWWKSLIDKAWRIWDFDIFKYFKRSSDFKNIRNVYVPLTSACSTCQREKV
jgi:hypothetical protein